MKTFDYGTHCQRQSLALVFCAWAAFISGVGAEGADARSPLRWRKLPPLPDREGFAAPFAGICNGALIVAGGTNFPDKRPWEGGAKVWHDSVFVLEKPDGIWRAAGKLPRPLGYGVSVTTADGVICAGGSDAERHHASVFLLRLDDGEVVTKALPPLPRPCANMSGAVVGGTLYLAGGIETPTATTALKTFWALDLHRWQGGWRELEPWPGPARMLAVAGAHDGSFFLFSGASLHAGADGKPVRTYLRDAYRFTPGKHWKRIADLPRAAVAAPSPAPVVKGRLVVIGGDDGAQVNTPPTGHKGFPRSVLAHDPKADRWAQAGAAPFSLVTTPAVDWRGRVVIPGGEARPGIRSTEVWSAPLPQQTKPSGSSFGVEQP